MEIGTPRTAPRAFYPDFVHQVTTEPKTPGWDPGPELRIDGGQRLRRVLGWSSIALAALGLALPRGRAHIERVLAAATVVAGVGALNVLRRRRRSWVRSSGNGRRHP
jgi:hypothetical protein